MRFAARCLLAVVVMAGALAPRAVIGADSRTIVGRVFDASRGADFGIHFASVELRIPGADGGAASATTGPDGSFAITLPPGDEATVSVSVSARGFYPFHQWSSGAELRQTFTIGLQPAPERSDTAITGLVYDASVGPSALIGGAEIQYVYQSFNDAFPEVAGEIHTGADGRYGFNQLLGPDDYVEITVAAPGFAPFEGAVAAYEVLGASPRDFGLAPIGGLVQIEPAELRLDCPGTFPVTITNIGPADETLVMLGLDLHFHYGGGVYGTAFTADLSGVDFPLSLASGEQLRFPMRFAGRGSFPSLLTLGVVSGAPDSGAVQYYGGFDRCDAGCAGDCDGNGTVSVDELIRAVNLALGGHDGPACMALDGDADGVVSMAELVAAVDRAIAGCP